MYPLTGWIATMVVRTMRKNGTEGEMQEQTNARMPIAAAILGAAGLLPQGAALLALALGVPGWQLGALAMGFAYAALIFSFLGGAWWGLAARSHPAPQWVFGAAVLPSLIALGCAIPWAFSDAWPGPWLIVLGLFILASPVIDLALLRGGFAPRWWLRLRVPLSLGLGAMTLAIGMIA